MKVLLAGIFVLSMCYSANAITFAFNLARYRKECFTESYNPNTLVKGSFTAKEPDYTFLYASITTESGGAIYQEDEQGQSVIKFSFTTHQEGNINICIENKGEKYIKIVFELLSGIEAGDISGAASDEDLKPIEKQLIQLDRTMESIKTTTSYIVSREEEKITQADSISTKLYLFSVITMVTMALISFLQAKYLKNFFKSKKLI